MASSSMRVWLAERCLVTALVMTIVCDQDVEAFRRTGCGRLGGMTICRQGPARCRRLPTYADRGSQVSTTQKAV
jgi:hypothetical protein